MDYKALNERLLHGGDYNPDQWLDRPDILEKDIELMKQAHINCVSLGIFSWAALEPEEGVYKLDWMKNIIDNLYENGIYTILATPSGARPVWMAEKHPEVLRVGRDLVRNHMGGRHNHCYTSPYYRAKVWKINTLLAQEFGNHPGVILWHISNEYSGECYCPLCQDRFRDYLKEKYGTLDNLNHKWWTAFWSHTYTSWEQIEPPHSRGEGGVHGLTLDWKRFVTDCTVEFCAWEKAAVRAAGSQLPVTTNFLDFYVDLNCHKFKDVVDIISWDSYPRWHGPAGNEPPALLAAFRHDMMRSIKKQPFLLMESVTDAVNWHDVDKLKRPGMHMLSSLQAVAHGSNSVQYFQIRKSRGCAEKFHGAVIGHDGTSNTRTFREVSQLGQRMEGLQELCTSNVPAKVAIIYDFENHWAIDGAQALFNAGWAKNYHGTVMNHYAAFWRMGIPVDVVDMTADFSQYKLVIAPMLYMYRENIVEKLKSFTENGGTLVGTYWSGRVDEYDLCFESFAPYGMHEVFGLYTEEIDALYPQQFNATVYDGQKYKIMELCELVNTSTAQVIATYEEDFYAGKPVLTENHYGNGTAFYMCARLEQAFLDAFYENLVNGLSLEKAVEMQLPKNVIASMRRGQRSIVFLQNYNEQEMAFSLPEPMEDMETGDICRDITMPPYDVRILYKK